MPELSLHHIDHISSDISRQEIVFSHLLHDLIDHVCCDVEYEMQQGLSFSEAYKKVKHKMGPRRLQEIQEETLFSVDTKYRYMKTLMKISGVAGTIIFGTAALFKIQHWPGAGIMLTLGALILAFFFLPSALGVLWKETHSKNKLFLFISTFVTGLCLILGTVFKIQHWPAAGILLSLAVLFVIFLFVPALLINRFNDLENKAKRPIYTIGSLGLIFYMTGMLFKIQHWPLATTLMILGVLFLGVIVFPWYTWIAYKDDTHIKASFIFIIIGTLAIVLPGALVNMNLQNTFESGYYPNLRSQQNMSQFLQEKDNLYFTVNKDSAISPQVLELHSRTKILIAVVNDIEVKMIQSSDIQPGGASSVNEQIIQTNNGPAIDVSKLKNAFSPVPVKDFLAEGTKTRQELNNALIDYTKFISSVSGTDASAKLQAILAPSVFLPGEMKEGSTLSMISSLHSLELLKSTLLTLELNLQSALSNKR
jgi:hypothetical protein